MPKVSLVEGSIAASVTLDSMNKEIVEATDER